MDISKSIKIALHNAGKSQKWLALEVGCTDQYISCVINNRKTISMQKLKHISTAFGLSVSEFVKLGEQPR